MRFRASHIIGCVTLWLVLVLVLASSFGPLTASAITKGYRTDDGELKPGMVAALSREGDQQKSTVERAVQGSESRFIGVAVNPDDSLTTIASANAQAYVETQGEVEAFVSDINGSIKRGDLLTTSPLMGILMRVDQTNSVAIAVAVEDFSNEKAQQYDINDPNKKQVLIQKLRINLDYKGSSSKDDPAPSALQRIAQSIVGRDVGVLRPLIALIVFLLLMVTVGAILYGSISSAVTSVGRNPLARGAVLRELTRIFAVVVLILAAGTFVIYGVLRF